MCFNVLQRWEQIDYCIVDVDKFRFRRFFDNKMSLGSSLKRHLKTRKEADHSLLPDRDRSVKLHLGIGLFYEIPLSRNSSSTPNNSEKGGKFGIIIKIPLLKAFIENNTSIISHFHIKRTIIYFNFEYSFTLF